MAEVEIGIMIRQTLAKPLAEIDSFKEQVRILTIKRNYIILPFQQLITNTRTSNKKGLSVA